MSFRQLVRGIVLTGLFTSPVCAATSIHKAPITILGSKIPMAINYPLSCYRLFKTSDTGEATPIPFQIDEINEYTDYVLPEAGTAPGERGNGVFDAVDELAFMGEDVGPVKKPTKWPGSKPPLVFEIQLTNPTAPGGTTAGAVYVGIYFRSPPELSPRKYVVFNRSDGEILTSRYRYQFDTQNYLVVRGVEVASRPGETLANPRILDSSTFYMKADLKYFVTVEANHRSIRSEIEAFKSGPVRAIVRVTFFYSFLRLNFELGMYTEVSFFSNSVVLPAVMYNPIDGPKSLNPGSGFYYGFALTEGPDAYDVTTNMTSYKPTGMLDFLRTKPKIEPLYWVAAHNKDRAMYVEIAPSASMQKDGILPMIYLENVSGKGLAPRINDKPLPLGKSPVNMALYFDLSQFGPGEHFMAFRLFFENYYDPVMLDSFRALANWQLKLARI
jgi:hypothetical protein